MKENINKIYKYSIRKFKVGVGSAIVGLGLVFAGQEALASGDKVIAKQDILLDVQLKESEGKEVALPTEKVPTSLKLEKEDSVLEKSKQVSQFIKNAGVETSQNIENKIIKEESEAPVVRESIIAESVEAKPREGAGFRNSGAVNTSVVNDVYSAVKNDLQAVNMTSPAIANRLAPARISPIEVINKRLEISKATNRNILDVPEEEATQAIKAEAVGKLNLDSGFIDAKNDLENLVKGAVADAVRLAPQTSTLTLVNKLQNNKEAFLLGSAYINKYYDLQFGNTNVKDILKTNPSFFGGRERQSALDFLIAVGSQNYDDMSMTKTVTTYNKLFLNKVSNKISIPEFLEFSNKTFNSGKTIQDWYVGESKAYISEVKSKEASKQDVSYRIYDKFKENTHLQYNILPLLAVSENSIYALSNTAGITYGIVDAYVNKEDLANLPQQLADFEASLDKANNTQQAFIDFWYRIAKPETHDILNEPTMTVDSLLKKTARNDGLISQRWSAQTGDKALLGVKEFITPMGLYANFVQAGGEASGNTVRLYMTKALETNGLTTYAHELTHIYEDKVWMAQGVRDGLQVEFYARGLYEPYQYFDEPYFNINTIFEIEQADRIYNQSPTRFKSPEDLREYMKGTFDVLYTLDLLEAEAVLSKSNADKKWWFNRIQMADTRYTQTGYTHKSNEVVAIDDAIANKLITVNDLVDNDIIAERTPVKSFTRTGKFENNDYYSIPLFSSNYAALENDKGVSGDYQTRRMAYELLAQYGYYEGMVPFISNQYKTEAQNAGQVLSDKYIFEKIFGGEFANAKEFKKEMFKIREDKLNKLKPVTVIYNGQTHTIDSLDKLKALFKEAVGKDLKEKPSIDRDFAYNVRNVEKLKEAIYKAYSSDTNEFRNSIYREPLADTNEPTTSPVRATWTKGYVAPSDDIVKNAVTIDNKLVKSKEIVPAETTESEVTVLVTYTDDSTDKVKVPVSIDPVTKQETTARSTRFERNDNLDFGQRETVVGKDGSFENVFTYVLENGRFVEKVNKQNEVAAIDDLIKVGTKAKIETKVLPKGIEYQADQTKDFGFVETREIGKDGQEERTTTYNMDVQGNVSENPVQVTRTEAINTVVVKGTKPATRVEENPFTVNRVESADLKKGTEKIKTKGQNEIVHYVTTYTLDQRTGEIVPTVTRTVIQEKIDEVLLIGILETSKGEPLKEEEKPTLELPKGESSKGSGQQVEVKPEVEIKQEVPSDAPTVEEKPRLEIPKEENAKGSGQQVEVKPEVEIKQEVPKNAPIVEEKPRLELPKKENAKGSGQQVETKPELEIKQEVPSDAPTVEEKPRLELSKEENAKGSGQQVEAKPEVEIKQEVPKNSPTVEEKPRLELPKEENAKGSGQQAEVKPEVEIKQEVPKNAPIVAEKPFLELPKVELERTTFAKKEDSSLVLGKIRQLERKLIKEKSKKVLPKTSSSEVGDLKIPMILSSMLLGTVLLVNRRKKYISKI